MANKFVSFLSRCGFNKCQRYFSQNLSTAANTSTSNSINEEEVNKFNSSSEGWWDENQHLVLQALNTIRVPFIRDGVLSVNGITTKKPLPLEGFVFLDVGCGGGILSESLARLGATVTGLDPGPDSIEVAIRHSLLDDSLKGRLNYVCDTVENFVEHSASKFDAIVCSEVIEHVDNPQSFVNTCHALVKEGGSMFFTTINRTPLSYVTAILFAEYVLNLVPRGIHDWNKFVTPKELCNMLQPLNCRIVSTHGYIYNPLTKKMKYCNNNDIMYALHAVK